MSLPGRYLTYQRPAVRRGNRVLITLVVITIAIVAYWAVNGGLEEIPPHTQNTTTVTE